MGSPSAKVAVSYLAARRRRRVFVRESTVGRPRLPAVAGPSALGTAGGFPFIPFHAAKPPSQSPGARAERACRGDVRVRDEDRLAGRLGSEEGRLGRRVLDGGARRARADEHVAVGELAERGLMKGLRGLALFHDAHSTKRLREKQKERCPSNPGGSDSVPWRNCEAGTPTRASSSRISSSTARWRLRRNRPLRPAPRPRGKRLTGRPGRSRSGGAPHSRKMKDRRDFPKVFLLCGLLRLRLAAL